MLGYRNRVQWALTFAAVSALGVVGCSNGEWAEPYPERALITITDSIGVEWGDSNFVLGAVADAAAAPDGSILVVDRSAGIVRRFDPQGGFIDRLSSQGSGPGELNQPFKLSVFPDGRMMIWDWGKQCIVLLDGEGESVQDIIPEGFFPPLQPVALENGTFAACDIAFNMEGDDAIVILSPAVFSIETSERLQVLFSDTLYFNPAEAQSSPSMTGLMGSVLMCSDGSHRICYTRISDSSYEVFVVTSSGDALFTAALPLPPAVKTEAEIRTEEVFYASMFGISELPAGITVAERHNMVTGINLDGSGNLWVQRGTEPAPVFDVFDPQGTHVSTVEFPREGRFWGFHMNRWGAVAWNSDPLDGVQKVYMLDLPEIEP